MWHAEPVGNQLLLDLTGKRRVGIIAYRLTSNALKVNKLASKVSQPTLMLFLVLLVLSLDSLIDWPLLESYWGGMQTRTGSIHALAPFNADVDGEEGYLAPVLGDGLLGQSEGHVTFLRMSGSSFEGIVKITGMMEPINRTTPWKDQWLTRAAVTMTVRVLGYYCVTMEPCWCCNYWTASIWTCCTNATIWSY